MVLFASQKKRQTKLQMYIPQTLQNRYVTKTMNYIPVTKITLVLLPRHSKLPIRLGTKATKRFVRKTTEDFVTRTTEDFVTKTRNCIPSPKTKLLFCYTYHELPFCLEDWKWFRRQDINLHPITRNYGYSLAQGPRVGFDTQAMNYVFITRQRKGSKRIKFTGIHLDVWCLGSQG